MKTFILLITILFLNGCSSESGAYKKSKDIDNTLEKSIPAPWVEINNEGSDYALKNKNSHSLFLFNSSCRKYEGGTLNSLTGAILSGIDNLTISEKNNVTHQGRVASEITASGSVDGIQRFFKIVTLQKNNCIYDYILISTTKNNIESDTPALSTFLQRIILN